MVKRPVSIHPFPARMAPEIALEVLQDLRTGSFVVDPMCGSGTVLRYATDLGHSALGTDLDPLAVLMARVWTTPPDSQAVLKTKDKLLDSARRLDADSVHLPWIDNDDSTADFISYWFAEKQARDLRCLASCLRHKRDASYDLLRLALSKIIVTKERGASLGRDVSHSRPHRVAHENSFDVFEGFSLAVERILSAQAKSPPLGGARVALQDGRSLSIVGRNTVDCVLTSPPYLNAIDYIRGHRLALVWLGYQVGELRTIRSESVGAERGLAQNAKESVGIRARERLPWISNLTPRYQGIFERYVTDLNRLAKQVKRVLKSTGIAVFIVGDSTLKGTFVLNSKAVEFVFEDVGFRKLSETRRKIPPNRRYLPPPGKRERSNLANRMRTEVVLTYGAAAT